MHYMAQSFLLTEAISVWHWWLRIWWKILGTCLDLICNTQKV